MRRVYKVIIILITLAAVLALLFVAFRKVTRAIYPQKYAETVAKYAERYDVDRFLVYAVIKCESNFNPDAISSEGALGLMQLIPDAFDWVRTKEPDKETLENEALFDPETGIRYGTLLLSLHLEEFETTELALCAYHAGRGKVNEWLAEGKLKDGGKKTDGIPTSDTRQYVKRVMDAYKIYQKLYGGSI